MNPTLRRVAIALAWGAACIVAVTLGLQRYAASTNAGQPDLGTYFLPAAQAIVGGESPWSVAGYFYSPLVALLLVPVADGSIAVEYWTALRLLAGAASCVLAAFAFVPRGAWFRAGIVAVVALVTLLWSWPTTVSLWLGQVELIVLLSLAATAYFHSRGHRYASGIALGAAAVLKTWPALFVFWLVRRRWRTRARYWAGVATAAIAAVIMAVLVGGFPGVVDMVSSPFRGADQELAANSVWGVGRLLFSANPMAEPVVDSSALRWTVSVVLALCVLALLATTLIWPGPGPIALFNLVLLVILLLPVSHFFYLILALPALWWWVARAVDDPRRVECWVVLGVLALWWVAAFRVSPDGDGLASTSWRSLLLVFTTSLAAATASVIGASRIDSHGAEIRERAMSSPA